MNKTTQLLPYTYIEGAENGLANVTVAISPGYSVVASDLVASGSYSFHLTHLQPADQFLTLNPVLRPSATSQLSFAKLLGLASSDEVARAQITVDGGATWQDLWSQPGSNGSGESTFSTVTVSLSAYAGQTVQIRFVYEFHSGNFYNCTSTGCGLYLDNIAVSNADQIANPVVSNVVSGTTFAFSPTTTNQYLLQVRAQINSRTLSWGPGTVVTVVSPPPVLQFVGKPVVSGGQIQVNFTVANYQAGMTLQLWKALDAAGTWTQDTSATLQTIVANSQFRFTTSTGSATRTFYRVKGAY